MKPPPDTQYGDNFPATAGWSWDPRVPWRHRHAMPGEPPPWLRRVGWWSLVAMLMGLLFLWAVRDGFSAEAAPSARTAALIVQFREGAVQYPEGMVRVSLHEVQFIPASLQRLNAHFGLIAVERVTSATRPTVRTFRLLFASRTGMARALAAYRQDPHVLAAVSSESGDLGAGPRRADAPRAVSSTVDA